VESLGDAHRATGNGNDHREANTGLRPHQTEEGRQSSTRHAISYRRCQAMPARVGRGAARMRGYRSRPDLSPERGRGSSLGGRRCRSRVGPPRGHHSPAGSSARSACREPAQRRPRRKGRGGESGVRSRHAPMHGARLPAPGTRVASAAYRRLPRPWPIIHQRFARRPDAVAIPGARAEVQGDGSTRGKPVPA
jgi:hypothetical protein